MTNTTCLNIFTSGFGSAIGGFIGVLIFFIFRFLLEIYLKRPEPIAEYRVANEINIGQQNEEHGEILHQHGKRIDNENEYKKLGFKNPVWEWTKDKAGSYEGSYLFYGPYTTDLNEPGIYEIIFSIKGIGFGKPEEIKNYNLFSIDVNEVYEITDSTGPTSKSNIIGREYIRARDLANGKSNFKIKVYSYGIGLWEYRSLPYTNNLGEFGNSVRVFFDKIIIKRIERLNLPWD